MSLNSKGYEFSPSFSIENEFKDSFKRNKTVKNYSNDEISFKLHKKAGKITKFNLDIAYKENYSSVNLDNLKEICEISTEKEENQKKREGIKRLKTLNLDLKNESLLYDKIKFNFGEVSSFALNSAIKSSGNEYSSFISSPSNDNCPSNRKKSYQEDLSNRKIFNSKSNLNVESIDSIESIDIKEKNMDNEYLSSKEEVKKYYEFTFESMKKIKKIINLPEHMLKLNSSENIGFEKDIIKNKKLIIFDIFDTLLHCEIDPLKNKFDDYIECKLNNKKVRIGITIRPNLIETLNEFNKYYTLVAFSTNLKEYTDIVLKYIDPQSKFFTLRFYRNDCLNVKLDEESYLIKDLRILKNFSLNKILIIDKSVISFALQLENGIPILPFINNKNDNELKILQTYLEHLRHYDDIVEENKKIFNLEGLLNESFISNKKDNESYEVTESSDLFSYHTEESNKIEKIEDSEIQKNFMIKNIKKIEKIEPVYLNFLKHNFNSNSSYESNSLLSCVLILNKATINYDSIQNNTNIFSDVCKSDSDH